MCLFVSAFLPTTTPQRKNYTGISALLHHVEFSLQVFSTVDSEVEEVMYDETHPHENGMYFLQAFVMSYR